MINLLEKYLYEVENKYLDINNILKNRDSSQLLKKKQDLDWQHHQYDRKASGDTIMLSRPNTNEKDTRIQNLEFLF